MLNIAICYWGMTRSTKIVYETHINRLFNKLNSSNIQYKIFMHTWKTCNDKNIIWKKESNFLVDYEEYKLLNPDYYKIDNQTIFLDNLDFNNYFYKHIYDTIGHSINGEWLPQLILNHLCALESQKRVFKMVKESNINFDYIIFIRPDVLLLNDFNINWLKDTFDITLLNYDHYEGYNDRFAIIPFNNTDKYSNRIDEIIEFRKTNGRIVSEKYVKYIVDKYYNNKKFIDFKMRIIRPGEKV
jgi:hypothetical protein